jgi:filamentous hemagglutinin
LVKELDRAGIKHTPEDIVRIARNPDGKVVFLEKGSPSAGLDHILTAHAEDFANRGIAPSQIPDAVMEAVTRGRQVGMQGTRPIFEVEFNGRIHRIAVQVSENGYVVGANPAR